MRNSGVGQTEAVHSAVHKELSTFMMGVVLKRFGAYGRVTLTSSDGFNVSILT